MNESHNWMDPAQSGNNNAHSLDWATMARQWVQLQQQQQHQGLAPQVMTQDEGANLVGGAQMAALLDPNNFMPTYQAHYDPYLQQQIMHQQILAAAHWAAANQSIYDPTSQYFALDSHLQQQQIATPRIPPYPYNHNHGEFEPLSTFRVPMSTQAAVEKGHNIPSDGAPKSVDSSNKSEETVPSSAKSDAENLLASDQSSLNECPKDYPKDAPNSSSELNRVQSDHVSKAPGKLGGDLEEKRALEPYRKKPIPAMTINRSPAAQTSAKPVSKIPQWLRDGLERIERERARKQEKERQELLLKEIEEDSSIDARHTESGYSKKPDRDSPRDRAHGEESSDEVDEQISKQEPKYPNLKKFMDGDDDLDDEERDQMLNSILRQGLTKLLLEETNQMIMSACSQIYQKMKEQSAGKTPKLLGCLIDYNSDSSSDEDDDDADNDNPVAGKSISEKAGPLFLDRVDPMKIQSNDESKSYGINSSQGESSTDARADRRQQEDSVPNERRSVSDKRRERRSSRDRSRSGGGRDTDGRRRDRDLSSERKDRGSKDSSWRKYSRDNPHHSSRSRDHDRSSSRRHSPHHRHGKNRHDNRSRDRHRYSVSRRDNRDNKMSRDRS